MSRPVITNLRFKLYWACTGAVLLILDAPGQLFVSRQREERRGGPWGIQITNTRKLSPDENRNYYYYVIFTSSLASRSYTLQPDTARLRWENVTDKLETIHNVQVGPSPRSKIFNKSGDDAACTTSVWFMSSSPARAGTHCLLVSQLPSWAPPDLHRAAAAHFFPDSKLIESFEDRISRDFSIHIFDRHREIRLYSVSEYCHVICIFLCNSINVAYTTHF